MTLGFGMPVWTLCDQSRPSHVTISQNKTSLYESRMQASTNRRCFDMNNKLRVLLTLLSLLTVVQLNSAFYHIVTAYMCVEER